ncbi:MAG: hypothetical protein AABY93_10605 [Bacteroidota bacterium]
MRGWSIVISSLFFLMSCKTTPDPIPDVGLDYFPLKVGAYQIYNIEETQISQSIEQKFIYELKLEVVDSAINQEEGYTYNIERKKRDNANLPWDTMDSWTARISNREAIITEGNISFVKLTFPIVIGLEWDGNAYNTLGGEQYCGANKDQSCDIYRLENSQHDTPLSNGITLAGTITVIQNENPDLIVKKDVRKEVYARTVGLIYKESVVLNYCTSSACLGQQQVDQGFMYKQTLKEYGSE